MRLILDLLPVLSPFIAAYLLYFFGIKGKRKEIDLQKERDLNIALSDLLLVWTYLSRIELVIKSAEAKNVKSIIPIDTIPHVLFSTGMLSEKCFEDFENSLECIKKYDPILYFELGVLGNSVNSIKQKVITPMLTESDVSSDLNRIGMYTFLKEVLNDVEHCAELIASHLSKDVEKKVVGFFESHINQDMDEFVKEMNRKYYELMIPYLPNEHAEPISYEAFVEFSKEPEFLEIIELMKTIYKHDNLGEVIKVITKNPNVSQVDLQTILSKLKNSKED